MNIQLIQSPEAATRAEMAVYDLLAERKRTSLKEIRDRLGLRSILPVQSRLRQLAAKGIIAIS
jgi:DNA-binding Lrp family transcriptional regulator